MCSVCLVFAIHLVFGEEKNKNKLKKKNPENKFALLAAQQLEENENHKLKRKLKLMESETGSQMRRSSEGEN